mgnify:FL=1
MQNKQRAFTLIELLVTIAIIAILSSITIVTFNGQSAKARDARRKSDLANLQQAIEMYYEDNGAYPTTDGFIDIPSGTLATELVGKNYIGNIPYDPQGTQYMYYLDSYVNNDPAKESCDGSATKYSLYAKLEKASNTDLDTTNAIYAKCNHGSGRTPPTNNKGVVEARGMNYRIGN